MQLVILRGGALTRAPPSAAPPARDQGGKDLTCWVEPGKLGMEPPKNKRDAAMRALL